VVSGPGEVDARLAQHRAEAARMVEDLEVELAGIVEAQVAVAPDDEHDAEGSTIGFERARVIALLAHARQVLADLDLARTRVAEGTYGRCTSCGSPITDERLAARPTATTCVACASATPGLGRRRPLASPTCPHPSSSPTRWPSAGAGPRP